MSYFEEDLSLGQDIDRLFFVKNAVLANEYDRLFDSVFSKPALIKRIVAFLYTRNAGYTRSELVDALGITDGGVSVGRNRPFRVGKKQPISAG